MIVFNAHSNSWCEKIIFLSISLICIILGLDYKFTLLPFHGAYIIVYILSITIATTWITFISLQNLLQHNKPFEYDLENNLVFKVVAKFYSFLNTRAQVASENSVTNLSEAQALKPPCDSIDSKVFQLPLISEKVSKSVDERIDDFVRDIEVRFVLKWYIHITDDPSFARESKVLLDEVIRRFLQIIVEVDGRKLVYGCLMVFLKHVKEFRRAVKRNMKSDGPIEELYRYSHVGSQSPKAMEHFIFHLTANILRQFINWELWNSLPCRSLVSILSRRFTTYMLTYSSAPGFLNYKIMQMCASHSTQANLKLNNYSFISLSDVDLGGHSKGLPKIDVEIKEKNIEALKNDESNTPTLSPKRALKGVSPANGKHVDVVDSCRKPKMTGISKLQNGTGPKPANNVLGESQTPVKALETKFGQSKKNVEDGKPETGPKTSEPVKIHESKSSTKTWRNSSDLECISLGQDLLAFQEFTDPDSQIQELIEKKLWKDTADPGEDDKLNSMWDIPESWYGEEEASDFVDAVATSPTSNFQSYLKTTANTASYITSTIKPIGTVTRDVTASTLHNMKELQQTTVNTVNTVSQATSNAMHKIGDLQAVEETPKYLVKVPQDEAAGMVEGILDFGMAGLRKGLRLTGLQENFTEFTQKAKNEFQRPDGHKLLVELQKPVVLPGKAAEIVKAVETSKVSTEPVKISEKDLNRFGDYKNGKNGAKLIKTPHVASEDKLEQVQSSSESDESVWINPLTKDESPGFDGHILLEKTPDSLPKLSLADIQKSLVSPDLEQILLSREIPQITEDILMPEESPDPEYEETQDFASTIAKLRTLLQQKSSESGFTTPALSPMPQDEIAKTPMDPPPTDLSKVDGAMPSLYKLCARTATGVFQNTINTIKTALPGNVNESNQRIVHSSFEDWTFVEADSAGDDFYLRMKKLLLERRAFCTVDTAYEAIDSLEVIDQPDAVWTTPTAPQFDDELDEFDVQVPLTKALVDIACELIGDTGTCLLQESVVKAVLLLIGHCSEEVLAKQADRLLHNVNKFVGKLPENVNQDVTALSLKKMIDICMEIFPCPAKKLLGESTLESGVQLFIKSLQSQRINQDICMQMFELFASELISACGQASPTYSA